MSDNCRMNFEFDYINIDNGVKVFSRVPPQVGDIVVGTEFDGVVYDYVIVKIEGNKYYASILRVNRSFYALVKQMDEKYKDWENV